MILQAGEMSGMKKWASACLYGKKHRKNSRSEPRTAYSCMTETGQQLKKFCTTVIFYSF